MREADKQFHFAKTNCNFLWLFSYFYYISEQAKILILCLKSQINSEGEAGVVCFGNINSSPAADGKIFSYKIIPQGKYFYSKIFFLA